MKSESYRGKAIEIHKKLIVFDFFRYPLYHENTFFGEIADKSYITTDEFHFEVFNEKSTRYIGIYIILA